MWGGLLASSCNADGSDKSNLPFLDLMARFTPIHLRLFSYVCKRASETTAANKAATAPDIYSTTRN